MLTAPGGPKRVLLVIPLDAQSPQLRLLRPQQQAIEALLSNGSIVTCFRPDLDKLRGKRGKTLQDKEKHVFERASANQDLVITDSQAIDQVRLLNCPNKTTFSVMQLHALLGPELFKYTVDSLRTFDNAVRASKNDGRKLKILVSEACQHDRIT